MTTIRSTHLATASPESDALAPSGSVWQVSSRQAGPLLSRKDNLHVAFWDVRILQDVGLQALTMQELLNHTVDNYVLNPELRREKIQMGRDGL